MDFFDTVLLHTKDAPALNKAAQAKGINLRVLDNTRVAVRERKHHASCVLHLYHIPRTHAHQHLHTNTCIHTHLITTPASVPSVNIPPFNHHSSDVLCSCICQVSFDETTRSSHLDDLFSVLASVSGSKTSVTADGLANANAVQWGISSRFQRSSEFLSHPVFHMYHSEHEMLRYLFRLQVRV